MVWKINVIYRVLRFLRCTNVVKVGTSAGSSGMGDVLLLTALCKNIPNCVVELHPKAARFARFFDGICKKVIITESPIVTPNVGQGHFAKRKLRYFGLENKCYLPNVVVSEEELERGMGKIAKYKNPLVFVPNTAKHSKHIREFNKEEWQKIVNILCEKFTVLQFGVSSNFTEFENTVKMIDLPVSELICYYSAIKKYVGVDTGDLHLMLAVGENNVVLRPSNSIHYIYDQWEYEYPERIKYVEFENFIEIIQLLK